MQHEHEMGMIQMLTRDHDRMRKAGTALAEAALYIIREHDGLHRLSLAVAAWAKAVADEGDRPFVPCDRRLPGLEYAEGIADHWHQRALRLMEEASGVTRRRNLESRAEGSKLVLDDIKMERRRLSARPESEEGGGHGTG